jgi:hypothetical protein
MAHSIPLADRHHLLELSSPPPDADDLKVACGLKVDVQNIIESVGAGNGRRVALSRSYHHTLEASLACNFRYNG